MLQLLLLSDHLLLLPYLIQLLHCLLLQQLLLIFLRHIIKKFLSISALLNPNFSIESLLLLDPHLLLLLDLHLLLLDLHLLHLLDIHPRQQFLLFLLLLFQDLLLLLHCLLLQQLLLIFLWHIIKKSLSISALLNSNFSIESLLLHLLLLHLLLLFLLDLHPD